MDNTQEILLQLLRVSLCHSNNATYDSSKVDWLSVINYASQQGVLGICFDALERLPYSYRPDIDNLMEWAGQTYYQENQYKNNWDVACKLAKICEEYCTHIVVLKGQSIAQYYPQPNHRYSCDLDLLILDHLDWFNVCSVLESKDIKLCYEVYKEVEFTYDGTYVECHRFITPFRGNKNLYNFECYLRQLLKCEPPVYFEGSKLENPPIMFKAMFYIEHALGDYLRGKLSLKHVVDWIILRKLENDWQTFRSRCKEFQFDRFLCLIDALADIVECKRVKSDFPISYQKAFDEILQVPENVNHSDSWFYRRVGLFFDIIRNERRFRLFGYCSMTSFLFNSVFSFFFRKEVEI